MKVILEVKEGTDGSVVTSLETDGKATPREKAVIEKLITLVMEGKSLSYAEDKVEF